MALELSQIDHEITLKQAIEMTTLYRDNISVILDPVFKGKEILPLNETFNRAAIQSLLDQTDCQGIRIYYSMDPSLKIHAILVGVNSKNADILPSTSPSTASMTTLANTGDGFGGII